MNELKTVSAVGKIEELADAFLKRANDVRDVLAESGHSIGVDAYVERDRILRLFRCALGSPDAEAFRSPLISPRRRMTELAIAWLASGGYIRLARARSVDSIGFRREFFTVATLGRLAPLTDDANALRWKSPVGDSLVVFNNPDFVTLDGKRWTVGGDIRSAIDFDD